MARHKAIIILFFWSITAGLMRNGKGERCKNNLLSNTLNELCRSEKEHVRLIIIHKRDFTFLITSLVFDLSLLI